MWALNRRLRKRLAVSSIDAEMSIAANKDAAAEAGNTTAEAGNAAAEVENTAVKAEDAMPKEG